MSRKNRFWIGLAAVLFFFYMDTVVYAHENLTQETVLCSPYLSDFFYVWLKRSIGQLFLWIQWFRRKKCSPSNRF